MLIDITPSIEPGISKVWPGDTPPTQEFLWKIADGGTTNLSTLHSSVHVGAHADAPCHYSDGGRSIDEQPLDLYIGRCEVMRVLGRRGERIRIEDLPRTPTEARLLLSTGTFDGFRVFNQDFSGLEPSLVDYLHEQGVRLVGTDAPSVDLFHDPKLLAHHRFLANDMAIIEGLALDDVSEGRYELIAPPLRLVGFDGSPVRAVLRSLA
ncbi:MAG: cyclase family protein [Planctomycetota bacterium]|nr:cyclase family protein [Planctomycetota bacterium]